jgi:hypothetical protein
MSGQVWMLLGGGVSRQGGERRKGKSGRKGPEGDLADAGEVTTYLTVGMEALHGVTQQRKRED